MNGLGWGRVCGEEKEEKEETEENPLLLVEIPNFTWLAFRS